MEITMEDLPEEFLNAIESADETLTPLSPEEGIERYLESKQDEVRSQTVNEYRTKLNHLHEFCEMNNINNLNNMTGRLLSEYKQYRRNETNTTDEPLNNKTLRDDMYQIRDLMRFLGEIEAVPADLHRKIGIPSISDNDGVRDIEIEPEFVQKVITHLEKYEYASRDHVIWVFFIHTGRRPGDLYAVDVDDLHLDDEDPYIVIKHRPDETELKNGKAGETQISISTECAQIFENYIDTHRINEETANGRQPFLTSENGRLSKVSIRKTIYAYSRPCVVTGECPHNRDSKSCEAMTNKNTAYKCPSSKPPYALRHGYITAKRRKGVPVDIVSDRCDVSEEVIDKHYDERTDDEKRKLRKQVLEEVRADTDQEGYL